jgi:hypothetical protein
MSSVVYHFHLSCVDLILRPNFLSLTEGYSRLWHRVVVPARRATWAGGPVRQPYAMVYNIPQSGTKNFASELLVEEF